jgi:hypothetical protein
VSDQTRFRIVDALDEPEFSVKVDTDTAYIKIAGGEHWGKFYVDVRQAAALRDWLNKALPVPLTWQCRCSGLDAYNSMLVPNCRNCGMERPAFASARVIHALR